MKFSVCNVADSGSTFDSSSSFLNPVLWQFRGCRWAAGAGRRVAGRNRSNWKLNSSRLRAVGVWRQAYSFGRFCKSVALNFLRSANRFCNGTGRRIGQTACPVNCGPSAASPPARPRGFGKGARSPGRVSDRDRNSCRCCVCAASNLNLASVLPCRKYFSQSLQEGK